MEYKEYIKYIHQYRPTENNLDKTTDNDIFLKCKFPKTIKKGTYIHSAFPVVSYDLVIEMLALLRLSKPIQVCATSGRWEGTPFLLYVKDDFDIDLNDEEFIEKFKRKARIIYNDSQF